MHDYTAKKTPATNEVFTVYPLDLTTNSETTFSAVIYFCVFDLFEQCNVNAYGSTLLRHLEKLF